MFTILQRGLVLKSKTDEKGQTDYTIILGKRLLFPWLYKTATLYKDWKNDSPNLELSINKGDSIKDIKKRNVTSLNEEEWTIFGEYLEKLPEKQKEYLKRNIENIPEKVKKAIYKTLDMKLFPDKDKNYLYGFEMQNINNRNPKNESNLESLSEKLSDKLYKKALSIIPILHL
jgi:hypothetical protein